jgi:hypothetical protein
MILADSCSAANSTFISIYCYGLYGEHTHNGRRQCTHRQYAGEGVRHINGGNLIGNDPPPGPNFPHRGLEEVCTLR